MAPDRVVDVLALTGDAVDNVKGVPGIGDKGARDLIAQFGSLDALLEGAASVQQKRYREALLANADAARASRELVTIRPDVPVDRDLDSLRYRGPDQAACYALFTKLGFRTFTSDFAPTAATVATDYAIVESLDGPGGGGGPGAVGRPRRPARPRRRCERRCGRGSWASRSHGESATPATCRSGIAPSTR